MLTYITKEAPTLKNQINNTTLAHKPLIKIAKKYHYAVCEDEDCTIFEKKEKPWVTIGLVQGYSHNLKTPQLENSKGEIEIDAVNYPGLEINIQLINLDERFSLKTQFYFIGAAITQKTDVYGYELNSLFLKVPIMLEYQLFRGAVNPYVSGGIVFNSQFYYKKTDLEFFDGEIIAQEEIEKKYFENYLNSYGAILSAGIKYKLNHLSFDFGLEYDYYQDGYAFNMLRPRLGIAYLFN